MTKQSIILLVFIFLFFPATYLSAADREQELRDEMWNSSDKDFKSVVVPEKWKDKSAVIIAKMHRFEYKKALMASLLRINEYSHFRIKLIDKNAINKYAEISFENDGAAGRVYAGFKIIKPNGKEVIVDLANAVKMERGGTGGKVAYRKIAIPNLEPGDILDYYICKENIVTRTSHIQFFDPVIYNLPQEYPVIKQKIQFKVERRCYINLRSLNGAPELKLVIDEQNDEQYYSLEDGDRDGVDDIRWLYPNREFPTVKFRASYASSAGMRQMDVLLGEPGELKSSVTGQELANLTNSLTSVVQYTKDASKHVSSMHKGVKDPFVISTSAYYYFRNQLLQNAESSFLDGEGLSSYNAIRFTDKFSDFLKSKKIAHDIIVGVDRDISRLEDIVIENELRYFIRVKKGSEYLYFSPLDIYTTPDYISSKLQGTEAYAMDGLAKKRIAQKIKLPQSTKDNNMTETVLHVKTTDMSSVQIAATLSLSGVHKLGGQYEFLDVYDVIEEENEKFKAHESFKAYGGAARKKYQAAKDAYLSSREADSKESLKKSIEVNYDFKIAEVSNFEILQSGRFDDAPDLKYSFDFKTDDLIKKTGPNYMVDIGKLIEQQVKIEADELDRKHGIYFDYPRTFRYLITFDIPNGYEIQGIEKLNSKVENETGGFTSTAKIEKGKLVIETRKHYDATTLSKDKWKSVVGFLNAANTFSSQKVLLKKVVMR
jgi:hypothetical protein